MRKILVALTITAFAAGLAATGADAAKTKMGCTVGKEKWDASVGKCMPKKVVKKAAKAKKA